VKCPNCGSGRNSKQRLGGFMERYTCIECHASWTDQIEAIPGRLVKDPVTGKESYVPGQDERL